MEPKDKKSEMYRMWDLSAGYHWVADDKEMLFSILSNVVPKEAHLLEFDGVLPSSYVDVAKLLYKVVASADELKGLASQRICLAIESFLRSTMTAAELKEFKKNNPTKSPIPIYKTIFEELEAEGRT